MMNRRLAHERRVHCTTQYLPRVSMPQWLCQGDWETAAAEWDWTEPGQDLLGGVSEITVLRGRGLRGQGV